MDMKSAVGSISTQLLRVPMEVGEEGDIISSHVPPNPSLQTLGPPISSSLGLALGLGLGFLLLSRAQSLQPLAAAINLAGGAIKGTRALRRLRYPYPPHFLLSASKVFIKGYNASKRLNPTGPNPRNPSAAAKRLKACLGAANLVRYARSPLIADGFLGLGSLSSGYKLSKNFLRVLEGSIGFQLDSALRNGINVLGLLVKTAIIASELRWRFAASGWGRCRQGFVSVRAKNLRYGARLSYKRIDFDRECAYIGSFMEEQFSLWHGAVAGGKPLKACLSEFLSLSIPIHDVIPLHML